MRLPAAAAGSQGAQGWFPGAVGEEVLTQPADEFQSALSQPFQNSKPPGHRLAALGRSPDRLLMRLGFAVGAERYGTERHKSQATSTEQLVAGKLKKRRVTNGGVKKLAEVAGSKVQSACRLRKETVMTVNWTAERLAMGSRNYPQNLVYAASKGGRSEAIVRPAYDAKQDGETGNNSLYISFRFHWDAWSKADES